MLTQFMQSLWSDESGQDLVEYVLIIVLVALAVFAALQLLGTNVSQRFSTTAASVGPS